MKVFVRSYPDNKPLAIIDAMTEDSISYKVEENPNGTYFVIRKYFNHEAVRAVQFKGLLESISFNSTRKSNDKEKVDELLEELARLQIDFDEINIEDYQDEEEDILNAINSGVFDGDPDEDEGICDYCGRRESKCICPTDTPENYPDNEFIPMRKPVLGQKYMDLIKKVGEIGYPENDPSNFFIYAIGNFANNKEGLVASDLLHYAIRECITIETIDNILQEFKWEGHSLKDCDDNGNPLNTAIIFSYPIYKETFYMPLAMELVWVDTHNPMERLLKCFPTWKSFVKAYPTAAKDIEMELYANGPSELYQRTQG